MAATSLYLAGIKIPDYMQSKNLFGKNTSPREFVVTARDRCDETVDHIRSIRKGDYLYIRNYLNKRPHLQPNGYKDRKEILIRIRELHKVGKLNYLQEQTLFADERPYEELYNIKLDKFQYVNLVSDKNMQKVLKEMRSILNKWEVKTNDQGRTIESPEVYKEEMYDILMPQEKNAANSNKPVPLNENMELMIKWAAEGK